MIKLAPLNPAVPEGRRRPWWRKAREGHHRRQAASVPGPLKDNTGKERVAAGKTMSDDEMQKMDFYVEGVQGSLPKK